MDGVRALFGLHTFPHLEVGHIGVRHGSLTAAAGELEVEVIGVSGHGARPHQGTDAIWIAARVVSGLQEAISRRLDPLHPVVVTFGRIEGGKAFNVISDHVRMLGTVRCLDPTVHAQLPGWIEDTVQALCRAHGGQARVRYRCIAPPVHNDPAGRRGRHRASGPGARGVAGATLAWRGRLRSPARRHPRHDVPARGGRAGGMHSLAQQHLQPR